MEIKSLFVAVAIIGTTGAAFALTAEEIQKRKTATSQYYVDTELEKEQPIFEAKAGNYIVTYPDSTNSQTAGQVQSRHIASTLTLDATAGDSVPVTNNDVPVVSPIKSALDGKQEKLDYTDVTGAAAGDAVTYGATAGVTGAVGVYSGQSYDNGKEDLSRASDTQVASVTGFRKVLECERWEGNVQDDDHCLIYTVDISGADVYVPGA